MVYSQTCCRKPQHNWVYAELKSPLSNYLTTLWWRVERYMRANLSPSMKYAGRSGWEIRGGKDSHWRDIMWGSYSTCGLLNPWRSFTFPVGLTISFPHCFSLTSFKNTEEMWDGLWWVFPFGNQHESKAILRQNEDLWTYLRTVYTHNVNLKEKKSGLCYKSSIAVCCDGDTEISCTWLKLHTGLNQMLN